MLLYSFVCISMIFIDCGRDKKLFKHVTIRGRIVHYITREPMEGIKIYLNCDDVGSASSFAIGGQSLGTAITDSEGRFTFETKASRRENYYLRIEAIDHYSSGIAGADTNFTNKDKHIDIGYLFAGDQKYYFKIHFAGTSGNCAWVKDRNNNQIKLSFGADTTLLYNYTASSSDIRTDGNKAPYSFIVNNDCSYSGSTYVNYFATVSPFDTVTTQINF
jgi:hypothetical protein